MIHTADVVIVGAGVIGCSIAHAFSRAGFSTLNVDALPSAGYGSTSHSSAIIRPFYSHPTACALAHAARCRWADWRGFLGGPEQEIYARYHELGGFILVMEGEWDDYAANLAALDDVGVPWEKLDRHQLSTRLPGLSPNRFGPPVPMRDARLGAAVAGALDGAIFIAAAGHVNDPQLAARNLWAAAVAHGARFLFGERVTNLLTGSGRASGAVLASGDQIHAPVLINAAGPHSAVLNRMAGIEMPIRTRAQRHEVAYVRKPAGLSKSGVGFLADLDSGFYARSDGNDLLIGTTDPACDVPEIVDPDHDDPAFTDQWTLEVLRAAQRIEGLAIENRARGTVGLYDVSDDWIPVYDKTPLLGYLVAIGTSGNQFKNAPYVGELMLAIARQALAGIDHDLEPASLHLAELKKTIDLRFYSRNRPKQSTRSVLA